MIIGVGIFKQKNRHKGEYLTREDEGAHDAFDADTAVLQVLFFSVKSQSSILDSMIFTNFLPFLQGRTGHHVEKKREWLL